MVTMRSLLVLLTVGLFACSTHEPVDPPLDPQASPSNQTGCFAVNFSGDPAPDVSLPNFIELSLDPAPGFVTPGRLAVREPKAATASAPISWWTAQGSDQIELVLGGGYTGYTFSLQPAPDGWAGQGTYFADFGVEPKPSPLSLRLISDACP